MPTTTHHHTATAPSVSVRVPPATFAATALLLLALLAPGCSLSDPAHYYVLTPATAPEKNTTPATATAALAFGPDGGVAITTFRLPAHLDRAEVIWRTSQNRVELSDTELWLEPLPKAATRVFAHDLAQRLGTKWLTHPPFVAAPNDLKVAVDIVRLEIRPFASEILLRANWTLTRPKSAAAARWFESGETILRVPIPHDASLEVCAEGVSKILDNFAGQIADAIRRKEPPRATGSAGL